MRPPLPWPFRRMAIAVNSVSRAFWKVFGGQMDTLRSRRLLLLALSLLLILAACLMRLEPRGDACEYASVLWAWYNHASPDLRIEDIEGFRQATLQIKESFWPVEFFDSMIQILQQHQAEGFGIYRNDAGRYYGYHFWIYSLLNVPAFVVLKWFGANPLRAFPFTNAILITLFNYYLLIRSRRRSATRLAYLVIFLSSGVLFYLKWQGPLIMTTSLLGIATITLLDQRCYLSTLCSALASLQDPSAALMMIAVGLAYLPRWFLLNTVSKIRSAFALTLLGSISFIPFVFFFVTFGIPSILLAKGVIDPKLIDLSRLASLYFDLNQGLIVAQPILLTAAMIGFGRTTIQILYQIPRHWFARQISRSYLISMQRMILLVVGSILMGVGTLGQLNWNSGQSFFNRYALWVGMPLLLGLHFHLCQHAKRRLSHLLIVCQALWSWGAIPLLHLHYRSGHDRTLKPWVKLIYDYAPALYNPEPQIFRDRIWEREANLRHAKEATYWQRTDGTICKVLFRVSHFDQLQEDVCGPRGSLQHSDGSPLRREDVTVKRADDAYLSGAYHCTQTVPQAIEQP